MDTEPMDVKKGCAGGPMTAGVWAGTARRWKAMPRPKTQWFLELSGLVPI
jgi:hypothetical protein